MKLKNVFQILGFRGKPKRYGYEVHDFPLEDGRTVKYARWDHPREARKSITSEMVAAYREILSEGDFCIDIGAHTGDSTLPIALAMNGTGCVLAMEPNPYLYHVLEKNARANRGIASIDTLMAAASTQEGFVQFEYSDSGFCNGGRHEDMSILTHGHAFKLDVFCVDLQNELKEVYAEELPKLKFIKTDTEGYDLYVLQTISEILKEYHPIIKAEIFKKTDSDYRKNLLSFLEGLDYEVYKVDVEPIHRGVRMTEANLEEWDHYDIICFPGESA